MTTGTVSYSSPPGIQYQQNTYVKSWNGTDGKKEIVNGQEREKWNSYNMTYVKTWHTEHENFIPGDPSSWRFYTALSYPTLDTPGIRDPNDDLRIQSKIVKEVQQSSFNAAVFLGEAHQTMSMIHSTVTSIALAAKDVRHGNITSAVRRLTTANQERMSHGVSVINKTNATFEVNRMPRRFTSRDISSRFLELQYGWKPLLNDVYAASTLSNYLHNIFHKATISRTATFSKSAAPTLWAADGAYTYIKSLVYHSVVSMPDPTMNQRMGLTNPELLAWELVPYSFVVDWFLPIGTFLENARVISGFNGRYRFVEFLKYEGFTSDISGLNRYIPCQIEAVQMTRVPSEGRLGLAMPHLRPFNEAMSPVHWANALALAYTAFGRSRNSREDYQLPIGHIHVPFT